MSLIGTLMAEKKVCKQRGEESKVIDGLTKMDLSEYKTEAAKAADKNEKAAEEPIESVKELRNAFEGAFEDAEESMLGS
jgi:hypothetical protein